MASSFTLKSLFFAITMFSISMLCCKSEEDGVVKDPSQIVAKALSCFNDKFVYSSCEESYRLTQSGNINVPREATDRYCNGACLTETHLVLNCIEGILTNFLFYNKATIQDIRATLKAGCSDSSERGNFNVAEHLQSSDVQRVKYAMFFYVFTFLLIVFGYGFAL